MRVARHIARLLLLAVATLVVLLHDVAAESPPPFVLIIHPMNPYQTVERTFVSDAFLKKTTRWPNGEVIKPVDLPAESPTRERFSQEVLKRSVSAVKNYWQQIIFSGRDVPPPELANDDAVVQYVSGHRGAIGYVSASARLPEAKVVVLH
jgi:ABC-type phosphate transport system substrate-binding protein